MKKIPLLAGAILCSIFIATLQVYAENQTAKLDVSAPDGIRPGGTLDQDLPAPKIPRERITAEPGSRNYPEQPPIIPHSIENYQLTLKTNRCLDCHRRQFTEGSGAPMISVTHFMDRDGQVLADVTPRRYFCTACHVQQTDAQPLVPSTFKDMLLVEPAKK